MSHKKCSVKQLLTACVLGGMLLASPANALTGATLDRTGLTKTFGDEFTKFDWYPEGDTTLPAGGTWRTNYGNTSWPIGDIHNRTLVWNGEEEIYVDPGFTGTSSKSLNLNPFSVKRGILSITAARTTNPALSGYRFTSGLMTTEKTFTQIYGVFEMRAKMPKGRGLWPAFWLLASDRTWPPEIDVMEILGHEPSVLYTTLHTGETGTTTRSDIPAHTIPDSSAKFHTYAVDWGPTDTVFYFDDREIARRPTPADMHKPFFMLINLAVGGGWPGSPTASTAFPANYEIDWVRAYKRDSYSSSAAKTAVTTTAATTTATPKSTSTTTAPTAVHSSGRRSSALR